MRTIYVVESHEQVLDLWRTQNVSAQHVLHLDFHCDLRGLLINRKQNVAHRIWDRFPSVDEGNFLTHAVLEGCVTQIRWVHDEPGGRQYDLKTVKYETDVSAVLHRGIIALRRQRGIPIDYQVLTNAQWKGIVPGEILDIDWDFFACRDYPLGSIEQRVAEFWHRDFTHLSEQIYVCYSPNYSHPTREQFRQFVDELAARFDGKIVEIPAPVRVKRSRARGRVTSALYGAARNLYHRAGLALRKRGIY